MTEVLRLSCIKMLLITQPKWDYDTSWFINWFMCDWIYGEKCLNSFYLLSNIWLMTKSYIKCLFGSATTFSKSRPLSTSKEKLGFRASEICKFFQGTYVIRFIIGELLTGFFSYLGDGSKLEGIHHIVNFMWVVDPMDCISRR